MQPVIAVLPPHVIDQIAAGEVIERPASVVKELVDNAVDAGARAIVIEAVAGGRGLVRVTDNGCGMAREDAVLAFERHATSKLRAVEDLWGLASMGFRGEALPSIAAVSKLVLTTRREQDLAATRIAYEGGRRLEVADAGAPAGTTVEVSELLYNVPARLKFLKGESTEASHITELVGKIALAYPQIQFRLRHNGRTALELPPERDGFARTRALLGARVGARMVPVSGEEAGVRVAAYLGAPELAQTTARGVQLFVGRRPVRDRGLLHAVTMGYGELVPRGRYPVAVVLLDVPDGTVDINVHPQKTEVRFTDAVAVAAAVRHVVALGVAAAPWRAESPATPVQMIASIAPPALPFDGHEATPLAQRYARELQARAGQGSLSFREPAGRWAARQPERTARREIDRVDEALERVERQRDPAESGGAAAGPAVSGDEPAASAGPSGLAFDAAGFSALGAVAAQFERAEPAAPSEAPGYFGRLRFLGQLDLTYLVCEGPGELVLVDQHAAHERVELARLVARNAARADRDVPTQKLLFPATLEATPAQLAVVEGAAATLAQIGFEAEAFGKSTIAIKAVPAGVRHGDPALLLRRFLDEWAGVDAPSEPERVLRALAEIACHSVVRAGDRLAPGEAEALLRALDGVDLQAPAPHGRATLLRLPLAELGRRFGR